MRRAWLSFLLLGSCLPDFDLEARKFACPPPPEVCAAGTACYGGYCISAAMIPEARTFEKFLGGVEGASASLMRGVMEGVDHAAGAVRRSQGALRGSLRAVREGSHGCPGEPLRGTSGYARPRAVR